MWQHQAAYCAGDGVRQQELNSQTVRFFGKLSKAYLPACLPRLNRSFMPLV